MESGVSLVYSVYTGIGIVAVSLLCHRIYGAPGIS